MLAYNVNSIKTFNRHKRKTMRCDPDKTKRSRRVFRAVPGTRAKERCWPVIHIKELPILEKIESIRG